MAKLRAKKVPEASVKPSDLTRAVKNKISRSLLYQVLKIAKNKRRIYYPDTANLNVASRNRCLLLVEKKLFTGKYKDDPWKYISDVNRVLNAIQKGIKSSRSITVQTAKEFQQIFSIQMDIIMTERGYCCGSWPILKTRPVGCEGSAQNRVCEIFKEGQRYWRFYQWTYCDVCFDKNLGDSFVPLDSDVKIKKSDFVLHQFVAEKEEPMVKCSTCLRRFHEICVLHHSIAADQTFICRQCRKDKGIPKTVLRATQLPCMPCDQHVQKFIEDHCSNLYVPIIVRTLGEMKTKVEVSKQLIGHRNGAREYPYKERKLFAFMDTGDDADICIFAVYYQMFDRECPKPNRNSVYINFMDSVQFLPSDIRSKVYHLILLGLFSHWSRLGYEYVYIWSAPPKNGCDYIFYGKPPSMKILDDDELWNWYCKLLQRGADLKVVKKCSSLKEFATSKRWKNFNKIPYFEGDACETKMLEVVETSEQMLKDLQAEMSRIERELGKATGNNVKTKTKRKKLEMQKELKTKELAEFDMKEKIWELMLEQLDELENEYVIVRLKSGSQTTQDVDYDALQSDWINCRHLFVDFFWGNMNEFSSVRRAKYSTHVMLHRIFTENKFCVRCESVSDAGVSDSTICDDCHKNTPRGAPENTPSLALLGQELTSNAPEQANSSLEVEPSSQVHNVVSETKEALVESTYEVIENQHEEVVARVVADPPEALNVSRRLRPRVQSTAFSGASKRTLGSWALDQEAKSFEPKQAKSSSAVDFSSQAHSVGSRSKGAFVDLTNEVIENQREKVVADAQEGLKWSRSLRSRLQQRHRSRLQSTSRYSLRYRN